MIFVIIVLHNYVLVIHVIDHFKLFTGISRTLFKTNHYKITYLH